MHLDFSSFFKVRRFHDEEDLRQQLRDWHHEVNEERPCRATGIIPALRLAEEAPRLRTLKVQPEQLALRIPVYVGPTGMVLHDGHAYSMPPEAISMPATLYLYGQRVRIVAGRYEAEHPRKFSAQESSSLPQHRAAMVAAVSGKRGKRYLKRQQLLELGEPEMRPEPISPEKREEVILHMTAGLVAAYRYFRSHRTVNTGIHASQPRSRTPKVGRNDLCPCGSGKKYKRCCGEVTIN